VIITSCSFFVNTKETEKKASDAFNKMNFVEFNKLYVTLEKADKKEAASYIGKIKKHNYFMIDTYSTEDALQRLESIKKQVPVLSKFAKKKIQTYTLIQITNNLDTIVMDGKTTGKYNLIIDTVDKSVEVESKLEDLVYETNKNLTNLEDINTISEYKDIQKNLIESVKDYRDKLQEKYMFYMDEQMNVISDNQLALQGNLFAANELVDLLQKFEQIQKELEFAGDTLQQRNEALRTKIGD
jgi:hypothetical protein